MVIWRNEGDEIGPNGNGAAHYPTLYEAAAAIREYKSWCKDGGKEVHVMGPTKVTISNREDLCRELNHVMGFGAS